ncbi:hypothetical protein MFIFM68171_09488 [Madurella fahalii]|uniref:DUF3669 domain-containing protein n=1 Tax=Madurella fahalii TaxID=1157608 RepID=A0ABQ0GNE6_9PEZI
MRIGSDHSVWGDFLPHLPPRTMTCDALITERILPAAVSFRDIIRELTPKGPELDLVLGSSDSDHCYIRLYLGRRNDDPIKLDRANIALHLQQMHALRISVPQYTVALADALAFLLWQAGVDANRVTFLFAPQRRFGGHAYPPTLEHYCPRLGWNALWLLGFDHCREMTLDACGVERAADAFLHNEPYFPRPGGIVREERVLWDIFRDRFILQSQSILRDKDEFTQELPRMLMDKITMFRFYRPAASLG